MAGFSIPALTHYSLWRMPRTRRRLVMLLAFTLVGLGVAGPAFSVTKKQVEEACSSSRAQYEEYAAARARFQEAADAYEAIVLQIDELQRKRDRVAGIADNRAAEMEQMQQNLQDQAVELYMQGGTSDPGLFFLSGSLDELVTGREFLASANEDSLRNLDDLQAVRADLDRFQTEMVDLDAQLRDTEAERLTIMQDQEAAADAERAAYDKLQGRCRELTNKYEAEQAAARAAARGGGAGAAGVGAISGFVCPFPGSSFIDSWGYPRSGGRRHQGVDMMGAYGAPLYATVSGTVSLGNSGLGGRTIWLVGQGYGYYYAHLSDFAVSSGQSVSAGQVIGYNGNSGNASGGAPHLHFEIHPGGRGAAAVNPYPTVAAACR